MKLIDTDALIEKINAEWYDGYPAEIFRGYVDNAPTIEPKKGKWEVDYDMAMTCSLCGCSFEHYGRIEKGWHYCPNCGARMERSEE